jgi:hypothetical protein
VQSPSLIASRFFNQPLHLRRFPMLLMTGLEFIMAARAFAGERLSSRGATLAIGRRIVNREVVGRESPDSPFRHGETVYAHTTISGHGSGFIEHVWTRNGAEAARHYLPTGDEHRWRSWSRHRLEAGEYTVEVLAPNGTRLAWSVFCCRDPERVPHPPRGLR